jgi:hypothetical protein
LARITDAQGMTPELEAIADPFEANLNLFDLWNGPAATVRGPLMRLLNDGGGFPLQTPTPPLPILRGEIRGHLRDGGGLRPPFTRPFAVARAEILNHPIPELGVPPKK